MPRAAAPLQFLQPAWFLVVIGLGGWALSWQAAVPTMGEPAGVAAQVLAVLAALAFAVLAAAQGLRARRHPAAWAEDWRHPVRHAYVAAAPLALVIVATLITTLNGPGMVARGLWRVGGLGLVAVTVWVMARWWRGNGATGLQWAQLTPALFIPVVGNVLMPIAGVPLGEFEWAAAHFGIALFFWPVLVALLGVRILVHGSWPERMRPSTLIFIAPPALVGLAAMRLGAPPVVGWMCWGAAVFSLAWVATQSRAIAALPFSIGHWGMGFPLCALCTLTLRLAAPGSLAAAAGVAMLVACSLLLTALTLATVRGLRDGSLLAPETVATIATRGSPQNSPQGPSQAPPV